MSTLTTLSAELLVRILGNLDARSLLRCESVSRFFQGILKDSSALQYIVELGFHGISDGGSKLPSLELIARLKQRQHAWDTLDWKKIVDVPMNKSCLMFELVGGVLGIAERHVLSFLSLPSWHNGDGERGGHVVGLPMNAKTWQMDMAVKSLTFDPSQDLSIILEDVDNPVPGSTERVGHLHLRTISGNVPHPLAFLPVVTFTGLPTTTNRASMSNTVVQVVDDVLALFFYRGSNSHHPRAIIWNWRKGYVIYDSATSGLDLPANTCHFSLLTRTTFILASTLDPSGSLHVFSFPVTNDLASLPLLCSVFLLPEIYKAFNVRKIEIHGARAEGRGSTQDLFMSRPEDGLVVVNMKYQYGGSEAVLKFSLYLHVQTLLRHSERTATDRSEAKVFDWPTWGLGKTQFLTSKLPTKGAGFMYGQRIVLGEHGSLDVLNLGPMSLRREPTDVSGGSKSTSDIVNDVSPTGSTSCTAESKSQTIIHRFRFEDRSKIKTSISTVTDSVANGLVEIKDSHSESRTRLFKDNQVYSRLPMRVSSRNANIFHGIDTWLVDGKTIVGLKLDRGTGRILGLRAFLF